MVGQRLTIDRQLGARIRFARVERNLSQAALGALLGISFEQVTRFESGDAHISSEQLTDIAAALGKSVSFFFHNWVVCSPSPTVFAKAGEQQRSTVESLSTWRSDSARSPLSGSAFRRVSPLERDGDWEPTDRRRG